MIRATVTIKALNGDRWILPVDSWGINKDLKNRDAQFSISNAVGVQIAEKTNTTLDFILLGGYRDIEIRDGEFLMFGGFIDEVKSNAGKGSVGSRQVACRGYFSLFEKRYTGSLVTYTATDAGEIAWDLINTTQSDGDYGDFGITLGVIEPSKDRDRTYRYRVIQEAIDKLTSDEVQYGFEMEINDSKVFNVYYPQKGETKDFFFDSQYNIDTWQVTRTGMLGMANRVIMFGEGDGDDMATVTVDAEDSYKEQYFLLEEGYSDKDNGDTDLLTDKGNKQLELCKYPRVIINITHNALFPSYQSYDVGDSVRIVISEEQIDQVMRVTKRNISSSGVVNITLE